MPPYIEVLKRDVLLHRVDREYSGQVGCVAGDEDDAKEEPRKVIDAGCGRLGFSRRRSEDDSKRPVQAFPQPTEVVLGKLCQ